jgi:F-type H+-transporting ATPase subunit epsilon
MLKLEIVTPERKMVDAEADSVTVPTASGEAGIMPAHAPLISALKPGIVTVMAKGHTERLAVSTGFVEVSSDRVSVLTDVAERAEDVDADRARADRAELEKAMAANAQAPVEENEELQEKLDLAAARLNLQKYL